jgi:hypothetical protein
MAKRYDFGVFDIGFSCQWVDGFWALVLPVLGLWYNIFLKIVYIKGKTILKW